MKTSTVAEFEQRFYTYTGSAFDICSEIYEQIVAAPQENRVNMFSTACKLYGRVTSDESYEVCSSGISKDRQNELKSTYGEIVDTLFESCLKRAVASNLVEEQLYEMVWESVVNNSIFDTDETRKFALYYILIDRRVPYFRIEMGLSVDNKDYQAMIRTLDQDIQKMRFVLAFDFEQKTQEASNLLDIILKQPDYQHQVVLLARLVTELKKDKNSMLMELLKRIRE